MDPWRRSWSSEQWPVAAARRCETGVVSTVAVTEVRGAKNTRTRPAVSVPSSAAVVAFVSPGHDGQTATNTYDFPSVLTVAGDDPVNETDPSGKMIGVPDTGGLTVGEVLQDPTQIEGWNPPELLNALGGVPPGWIESPANGGPPNPPGWKIFEVRANGSRTGNLIRWNFTEDPSHPDTWQWTVNGGGPKVQFEAGDWPGGPSIYVGDTGGVAPGSGSAGGPGDEGGIGCDTSATSSSGVALASCDFSGGGLGGGGGDGDGGAGDDPWDFVTAGYATQAGGGNSQASQCYSNEPVYWT